MIPDLYGLGRELSRKPAKSKRARQIERAGKNWEPPRSVMEIQLMVLAAFLATELSEGQASKVLGVDRVTLRTMRDYAVLQGLELAEHLLGGQS